jgi:hypothetical protein
MQSRIGWYHEFVVLFRLVVFLGEITAFLFSVELGSF